MPSPLVSICVPTRNRAAELREGLRSIQAQNYSPLEILISDNASEDDTEDLCRRAQAQDARIRYVRQPRDIGLYGNHNFCIESSRGEFLAFFHDHDHREPGIVRRYAEFLCDHPEVGVVCSDWAVTGEGGRRMGLRRYPVAPVTPGLQYIEETLRSGRSSIAAPGAMIRRQALGSIRFEESGPIGFGDFVVWFQMAERWAVGHIPEVLWSCQQDRKAQSARTIVSMAYDYDVNLNRYCDAYQQRFPQEARRVRRWRRSIRRYLFWALAFEVGLYYRGNGLSTPGPESRTLFELFDYRLTPEGLREALSRLSHYRTGITQYAVFGALKTLVQLHATRPLAWATAHPNLFRKLLGLTE